MLQPVSLLRSFDFENVKVVFDISFVERQKIIVHKPFKFTKRRTTLRIHISNSPSSEIVKPL